MFKLGRTYKFKYDDWGKITIGSGKYIGEYQDSNIANKNYLFEVPFNDRYGVSYNTMMSNSIIFKEQLSLINTVYIQVDEDDQFYSRQIGDIINPTFKEIYLEQLYTYYQ